MSFWQKARHSLSLKLMLLFILSSVTLLILFQIFVGSSFKHHFEHKVRPHFQHYIRHLHREIGYPPNIKHAKELSDRLLVDIIIDGPDTHWSSTGVFPDLNKFHFKFPIERRGVLFQRGFYRGQFIVRIKKQQYTTLFITRGKLDHFAFGRLIVLSLVGIISILGLLYFAIRWLFQPLKTIQSDIQRIGSGELTHRIKTKRKDEFGELAQTINKMADDIEQMLKAKRQLLLAISHELRSPITRAKVALSIMESSRLKQGLEDDMNEMENLIHELLEAERLKNSHNVLNRTDCSLNEIIQQVISDHFSNENINLILEKNLATLALDDIRIKFVIKNLLNNAIKHKKSTQQAIDVTTQCIQQNNRHIIKLSIKDNGLGIAAKHLPHLSQPFYRADPSRQRKTGGYGLGLYLVRLVINAHGGEFLIESELGKGTCVTIKMPQSKEKRID
jgi:signal transduction histidine kinase